MNTTIETLRATWIAADEARARATDALEAADRTVRAANERDHKALVGAKQARLARIVTLSNARAATTRAHQAYLAALRA